MSSAHTSGACTNVSCLHYMNVCMFWHEAFVPWFLYNWSISTCTWSLLRWAIFTPNAEFCLVAFCLRSHPILHEDKWNNGKPWKNHLSMCAQIFLSFINFLGMFWWEYIQPWLDIRFIKFDRPHICLKYQIILVYTNYWCFKHSPWVMCVDTYSTNG